MNDRVKHTQGRDCHAIVGCSERAEWGYRIAIVARVGEIRASSRTPMIVVVRQQKSADGRRPQSGQGATDDELW